MQGLLLLNADDAGVVYALERWGQESRVCRFRV
jgi:hypothetical protein